MFRTARIYRISVMRSPLLPATVLLLAFGTWFTLIAYYSTILSHLDGGEEDAKLSILECARVR